MKNLYLPFLARLEKVKIETEDKNIKSFDFTYLNEGEEDTFSYLPGQFAEISVFGKGESPFGMASSPTERGHLKFSINKVGVVTSALHDLEEGEVVGIRGPLGNHYPLDAFEGKDVVIIGGGFAFTTLRSLLIYMQNKRDKYKDITVIYGSRSPGLLLYKNELEDWKKNNDLKTYITVDKGDDAWDGLVGFVPNITKEAAPSSENAYAVVCGPPIMIKFTIPVLTELGFKPDKIILSLEMRMKCGIGICGRCNIGSKYVCKDGPVFTLEDLRKLPEEY
jgi:sulfhydrogenase subunit gamma (sulfur reductase)